MVSNIIFLSERVLEALEQQPPSWHDVAAELKKPDAEDVFFIAPGAKVAPTPAPGVQLGQCKRLHLQPSGSR